MTQEELDKDMIESIEMWLRENELQYVEKELTWLEELRSRLIESEIPKNLEEAAWDCVLDSVDVNNPVLLPKYKELLTYLFIAGAKWDRSQMMREAVEGEICHDRAGVDYLDYDIARLDKYIFSRFKVGDKVRIIVIPNTDEK